jgi:hypothetical protein
MARKSNPARPVRPRWQSSMDRTTTLAGRICHRWGRVTGGRQRHALAGSRPHRCRPHGRGRAPRPPARARRRRPPTAARNVAAPTRGRGLFRRPNPNQRAEVSEQRLLRSHLLLMAHACGGSPCVRKKDVAYRHEHFWVSKLFTWNLEG